jgi:hypothetical protein
MRFSCKAVHSAVLRLLHRNCAGLRAKTVGQTPRHCRYLLYCREARYDLSVSIKKRPDRGMFKKYLVPAISAHTVNEV